ncbi:MAG: nickel-responsive transcriptional regulator NikR [Zoogloea sp.]|nr:nickel-responsive transcriptional regulator NikR [Zoogloea sp.]
MDRFTISLDEDLAAAFDALIAQRGYRNRSEAVRDILRAELEHDRQAKNEAPHCIANLSYVYNHHERELSERLTGIQHDHHDLTVATLHAHLDHDNCIESVILKGPTTTVRAFAQTLMAERGVRHGSLNLISVDVADPQQAHGAAGHSHPHPHGEGHAHPHVHYRPKI